jgi:hypothetical protein
MATTIKAFGRGAFATSSATLYTVPASTTSLVTNILVTNTSASSQTFTITFDSVEVFAQSSIAANTTIALDLKQAIATTKIVAGFASSTDVKYHITGAEIA